MPDSNSESAHYLHLIRQGCPLPRGTHVVGYYLSNAQGSVRDYGPNLRRFREILFHHD